MSHYLSDVRIVTDLTFATALVYLGYELYSIKDHADKGRVEFRVVCPEQEFNEHLKAFTEGQLALSDARAFGRTNAQVRQFMRLARQNGEWLDNDLVQYARDTNFKVA